VIVHVGPRTSNSSKTGVPDGIVIQNRCASELNACRTGDCISVVTASWTVFVSQEGNTLFDNSFDISCPCLPRARPSIT